MATAVTDGSYLTHIQAARTHIQTCFTRAHELLTVREANLLRELDNIQTKCENDAISHQEELRGLQLSREALNNNLRDNDTLNEALATINRKIDKILKLPSGMGTIRFQWNTVFERDLEHAGSIITTQSDFPDFRNKSMPVISCCKQGTDPGQFLTPRGVAIDPQSERIYVVNGGNNRVQVFSSNGEYCFMFSEKMDNPWGILIHDGTVYVSQLYGHIIRLYALDGEYVKDIGTYGYRKEQFKRPAGMAISPTTGYLYVCECNNDRVQIFEKSHRFHSIFGDDVLKCPWDVKITSDLVIVLDESDLCIHLFSSTYHSLLTSIISRGEDKLISNSQFFTIDRECNLILTDVDSHCVKVFSRNGEFIAQIGRQGHSKGKFSEPSGIIGIEERNRIIVISQNHNCGLQIF